MQELWLYDEIVTPTLAEFGFGVSAKMVAHALEEFSSEDVLLHMNTPGGIASEGMAMGEAVAKHGRVVARAEGVVASAGTFPFLMAARSEISKTARMMIHEARGGGFNLTGKEMQMEAEGIEGLNGQAADLYAEGGKHSAKDFRAMMDPGRWFTASQAVKAGLAEEITDAGADVAPLMSADRHAYMAAPEEMLAAATWERPWVGSQDQTLAVLCGKYGCPTSKACQSALAACGCKKGAQATLKRGPLADEAKRAAERQKAAEAEYQQMLADYDVVAAGGRVR